MCTLRGNGRAMPLEIHLGFIIRRYTSVKGFRGFGKRAEKQDSKMKHIGEDLWVGEAYILN